MAWKIRVGIARGKRTCFKIHFLIFSARSWPVGIPSHLTLVKERYLLQGLGQNLGQQLKVLHYKAQGPFDEACAYF